LFEKGEKRHNKLSVSEIQDGLMILETEPSGAKIALAALESSWVWLRLDRFQEEIGSHPTKEPRSYWIYIPYMAPRGPRSLGSS
jgi:hypothetical protein